ncbi:UvrD-helicase-domain-containing protein [Ceratobasidium sp. AG-I]|nr:UvrD-helicase-domain-containing protein [Ceratobasidium sp. AG-I]
MAKVEHLQNLNEPQHEAVTFKPSGALQILAGPGSGKTRVLTCRVANLIITHSFTPSSICAVTFTNKAAAEMRARLTRLVGAPQTAKLVIGTFHAICANFLRKYGNAIGLATNFSICDTDESKKTVVAILQKYTPELESASITLKEGVARALISKAKATGQSPQEMLRAASSISTQDKIQTAVAHIYEEYDAALRAANALDFDDLLVMGLQVLKAAPRAISNLKHVVVDEFQDTNTMQYEIMRVLADACGGCVSVVGDPDQSIYGWRSADVTNLSRMRKDFPDTHVINLEENYRSTGSIVSTSLAIVSQDKQRLQKSLFTSHAVGPKPLLREFPSAAEEAGFIAREIRRVVASSGGMITFGDCAILLRFSALSRAIEAALQQESVPSRVLGGHKFFERAEVKDVLVYLQLADNPAFTPAFVRVVNVPRRGVGEKSIAEIIARATAEKTSALAVIERICDGTAPDIKPPIKRKVAELVRLVRQLRKWAAEGVHAADLIRRTVEAIGYEAYLQRTQSDWEARWENVQELVNFAAGVGASEEGSSSDAEGGGEDEEWDEGGYPEEDEDTRPSENEIALPSPNHEDAQVHASTSKSQLLSGAKDKSKGSDKPESKKAKAPGRSTSQGAMIMKQGTLSKWRSAPPTGPAPPAQPNSPIVEDILDLTGSDDDGAIPPKPGNEVASGRGLARGQRGSRQTPLRTFLQASMLSTDSETKEDDGKGAITITTCHAAKGLEWPVVVVPAVEGGTYPFYRAEDVEEERRLLYVACTRAQALLYLTHSSSRMVGGETRKTTLSEFASCVVAQDSTLFQRKLPSITKDELKLFGKILTRIVPTGERVEKCLKDFRQVQRLRDHELDESSDPDEASSPAWKYTGSDFPSANRAGSSTVPASHEGFTNLSLASITAFGANKPTTKPRPNAGAASALKPSSAVRNIKGKSANAIALLATSSVPRRDMRPINVQPKPKPPSAMLSSSNPPPKVFSAPPKPANSAFRPPTFITHGGTPNSASATGVKRRLGMGHLSGGSSLAQKSRKVDKEGKAAGGA